MIGLPTQIKVIILAQLSSLNPRFSIFTAEIRQGDNSACNFIITSSARLENCNSKPWGISAQSLELGNYSKTQIIF
jgi:hypothetical protein